MDGWEAEGPKEWAREWVDVAGSWADEADEWADEVAVVLRFNPTCGSLRQSNIDRWLNHGIQ